jgi:thioredoxin 1
MAEIKKINSLEEYDEFVNAPGTLNVIKVGAEWCGQCRVLEGYIKNLSQEDVDGVLLGEVDADDEWFEDKVDELGIRGIPVLVAFNGGEEKERLHGAAPKDSLISFFNRNK